jgi:hypothetical protein
MGETSYSQIRQAFDRRMQPGEFREAQASVREHQITTAAMLRMVRETIGHYAGGQPARV